MVNKTVTNSCSHEAYTLERGDRQQTNRKMDVAGEMVVSFREQNNWIRREAAILSRVLGLPHKGRGVEAGREL